LVKDHYSDSTLLLRLRTFAYNESSGFGACDGEDYGFINESVYNVEESPSLAGYASTPISTLASEIVSEFWKTIKCN